ncbi:MAG: hypothetical protein JWQ32_2073 [Marmoricola sp.]|nr:hypothetical protein [Marmoricola sp.]
MTTAQDAYAALIRAGASRANATLLTAIGGAESGWNLNAVGDIGLENATWGPSYGIWQIRTLVAETGKGTTRDINKLKTGIDAQAAGAVAILHTSGVHAWSTYSSGSYTGFIPQAQKAAASAPTAGSGSAATGTAGVQNASVLGGLGNLITDPLGVFGNAAKSVSGEVATGLWSLIAPFALKALFAVGGIALVVVGLSITAKPVTQPIVEKVEDTAQKAQKGAEMAAIAG